VEGIPYKNPHKGVSFAKATKGKVEGIPYKNPQKGVSFAIHFFRFEEIFTQAEGFQKSTYCLTVGGF